MLMIMINSATLIAPEGVGSGSPAGAEKGLKVLVIKA
jgi:hypothetical protein